MKDINFGKELVNKVKNILKNYDFEIIASENKSELTRFAESYIHQNVAEADLNLTVKIINENRIGAVQMNSIDEATISKNIEKAIEFYRDVIGMEKSLDREFDAPLAQITGLENARARIVHMRLGESVIELFDYKHPQGREPRPDHKQADYGLIHIGLDIVVPGFVVS